MDPAAPLPEPPAPGEGPRPEPTEFLLEPDEPAAAGDTPENLSATGEFRTPPGPPGPEVTRTADGGPPREAVPADEAVRLSVPGYEILRELGRGGMGVVYLARQLDLNRLVALKMILSGEHAGAAERDRFRREAEAVAALQHPNIVQIFEVGETSGRPYLAFEYVGGG